MISHCPCIATNHGHVKGECDEPIAPQPEKGAAYVVCYTCRYATSPIVQEDKDEG